MNGNSALRLLFYIFIYGRCASLGGAFWIYADPAQWARRCVWSVPSPASGPPTTEPPTHWLAWPGTDTDKQQKNAILNDAGVIVTIEAVVRSDYSRHGEDYWRPDSWQTAWGGALLYDVGYCCAELAGKPTLGPDTLRDHACWLMSALTAMYPDPLQIRTLYCRLRLHDAKISVTEV